MNPLIKELASKALKQPDTDNDGLTVFDNDELEKFAELIVRECVDKIVAKGTDWVDFAPSQTGVRPEYWAMAQQIKEHFGVE